MTRQAEVAAHAYPWDVLDGGRAAEAALSLGATSVNLAAAYHSVRAATPTHPTRRVVLAATSALYLPLEDEVWQQSELRPGSPVAWSAADAYAQAQQDLQEQGLRVRAWIALSHVDGLGPATQHCVRNAFGEVLPHALCPSRPQVQQYAAALVEQVCRAAPDGLVVEACGQLGLDHGAEHDKTAGADWSGEDLALLSVCVCDDCRTGWVQHGLPRTDAGLAAQRIRSASPLGTGPVPEELEATLTAVVAHRRTVALRLRHVVEGTARNHGVRDVGFHAGTVDAATSPAAPVLPPAGERSSSDFVLHCWAPGSQELVCATRARLDPGSRVAAYVTVLPPASKQAEALAVDWAGLLDAGADRLDVYHLGLASSRRLEAAVHALALVRAGHQPTPRPPRTVEKENA